MEQLGGIIAEEIDRQHEHFILIGHTLLVLDSSNSLADCFLLLVVHAETESQISGPGQSAGLTLKDSGSRWDEFPTQGCSALFIPCPPCWDCDWLYPYSFCHRGVSGCFPIFQDLDGSTVRRGWCILRRGDPRPRGGVSVFYVELLHRYQEFRSTVLLRDNSRYESQRLSKIVPPSERPGIPGSRRRALGSVDR